jgi:hypothetical protein
LIIITNNWHMPRVKAIFSTIFSLPQATRPSGYRLQFQAVENVLSPTVLQLRENREKQSLQNFVANTVPLLRSLSDAHHFLFRKHNAYSVERLMDGHVAEKIDPQLLKSY